jgi:flagellin-like protein
MMTIMGKRFTNRGISTIIAALLLIAIAIAAGVLLYVFAMGLIGSLQGTGGQQTKDQVIMEAFQWTTIAGPVTVNVRNTGSTTVSLSLADYYLGGLAVSGATATTCTTGTWATVAPGTACTLSIPVPSGLTPTSGVAYVFKIGLSDGGVMSYSIVAGTAS